MSIDLRALIIKIYSNLTTIKCEIVLVSAVSNAVKLYLFQQMFVLLLGGMRENQKLQPHHKHHHHQ